MSKSESQEILELKAQLKTLSDDVAALNGLIRDLVEATADDFRETIKEKVDDVSRLSKEAKDKARQRTEEKVGALEHHIAEKPLQSALIAFLIGALFGGMTRR